MKKKIIFGALTALFLSAGIFAATNLQEREQVSDLTLANIEALTSGEGGSSGSWTCYMSYSGCWFWNCSTIYYCGNPCVAVIADGVGMSGTCWKN